VQLARENDPFIMPNVNLTQPINDCGVEVEESQSLWMIFIFGLLGGLLALLTPCVFPMIPLTVSFFTKGAEGSKGKRNAFLYGFFILLIYFLLSLPFHLTKNVDPEILNTISTNAWLNIAFFVIFIVFALSFFGFYEIKLPSSIANKADSASDIGGLIGIFFMALTLAIVSFSCTGPILGSVIGSIYGQGAQGLYSFLGMQLSLPATKISAAMLGFGIGLGGPFGLFAAFPSLLKKLPKSGGWMDDFKVSLGFMEVALAIKFLSMADLVQQWGIITREVFFASWIIIGVLWVLYLLGLFKFKPGQGSKGMSKFKLAFTVIVALFTLRLVPGVFPPSEWNKIAFLSGFPPPSSYTLYDYKPEFKMYHSLEEGLQAAREQGKPVFIDFTGWACVNCRSMEVNVWPTEPVRPLLENDFVLVSLYVDEDVELPKEEQFVYTTRDGRKKRIKTVGNKWATLQTETFNNNSQPMYAIISPDGDLLAPIEKYNKDEEAYADWLKCGLEGYRTWQANAQR
jgi:thiol:disulfide interchange protein